MKPYRGIVRIECSRKAGCLKNLKKNVQAGCMDCPEAVSRILDLDGRVIYTYRSPEVRTGKRTPKKTEE